MRSRRASRGPSRRAARPPLRRAAPLLALVALAASVAGAEPTVILISWDGARHDALERAALPGLARLAREGARAERLVPPFPSTTFPGHVSLATGTHPDRHGIVGNHFVDRERGVYRYAAEADWIEAEPLWVAAERQGVRAAVFFWVGSETDWRGVGASLRVTPFDADIGEAEKVEAIVGWLDRPAPERPRLVMAWWHGPDAVAHRKGPDHPDVADALAGQDAQLVRLLAALDARDAWRETTLLVVSDHGMAAADRRIDLAALLARAGVAAEVAAAGGMAHVYLADPARRRDALAALAAQPGVRAFASDALPERLRARHPRRTGDLVVIAEPPYAVLGPPGWRERLFDSVAPLAGWRLGMHGYDPAHPDMAGLFVAAGRGVPRGAPLGTVRAIDVAPTVAALLGIEPPRDSEGTARLTP